MARTRNGGRSASADAPGRGTSAARSARNRRDSKRRPAGVRKIAGTRSGGRSGSRKSPREETAADRPLGMAWARNVGRSASGDAPGRGTAAGRGPKNRGESERRPVGVRKNAGTRSGGGSGSGRPARRTNGGRSASGHGLETTRRPFGLWALRETGNGDRFESVRFLGDGSAVFSSPG